MRDPKICMRGQRGSYMSVGLRELAGECLVPGAFMAEIGVYAGQSTCIFLETGLVEVLWAVDPWRDNYDPQDPTVNLAPMRAVRKAFYEQIVPWREHVIVYQDFSAKIAPLAPDHYFDLVYIDAKHQYRDVLEDIGLWRGKVKPGGYLAGHDYGDIWPGVRQAVDEVFGQPDKVYCDTSWVKRL